MDPNLSAVRLIASKIDEKKLDSAIKHASHSKYGSVYVNMSDGTLSSNKTKGAVKIPLEILKQVFIELKLLRGITFEAIQKTEVWSSIPNAGSLKKLNVKDTFKSVTEIEHLQAKHQLKLEKKLEEHLWKIPVHFVGAVKHSSYQYVGDEGKTLDIDYQHEINTISNKIFFSDEQGKPILDEFKNPQYQILIPGLPDEIHVYADRLLKAYGEWDKQLNNVDKEPRFDAFVQKKILSKDMEFISLIRRENVRYLNAEELKQTKLTIEKNGIVKQIGLDAKTNELSVLKDSNNYAYVIGKNIDKAFLHEGGDSQAIYCSPKVQQDQGKINHSSFFSGGKVESAGTLEIKNGKIVEIMSLSGHYKPGDDEMAVTLRYLRQSLPPQDFEKIIVKSIMNEPELNAKEWLKAYDVKQRSVKDEKNK